MGEVFMDNKCWILCAIFFLSVNLTYAVEGKTKSTTKGTAKAGASPAPLFKDPTTSMEMVYVKGGCYKMGNIVATDKEDYPEEFPAHEVCVDDFYMGKYEVTQGQWKSIMGNNTSDARICAGDNCPVMNVSWDEVQDFISKLNSTSGASKYRLPTEAEWEYAARSKGKRERYAGGNDVDSVAWYKKTSRGENKTFQKKNRPVGTKAPNGLGLYDMSGNVWEMTNDWYDSNYYAVSPRNNPTGPSSGDDHVMRGGCTTGAEENQRTTRRSALGVRSGGERSWSTGFRLLRTP